MGTKERPDGYIQHTNDRSYRQNEHVRAAEEKLGRRLGKNEVPHHIDENKKNNSPENLLILRSESDHRRIHSKMPVEILQTADGSHVVVKQQRECPQCNRLFEPDNNHDVHCSAACYLAAQTKHIPSAAELKELVWTKPTTQLAEQLGISDVAISHWCTKFGIEKPGRGYWRLVATGKVCPVPAK